MARDVGQSENCDILEFKRRMCLLEERRIKCVTSAEKSSQTKIELSSGFSKGEVVGDIHKQFQGSKGRNFIYRKYRKTSMIERGKCLVLNF